MSNFVFYDFETSSSNKYWGQIIQIGAVLTNDNLDELDRYDARCRLSPGVIPEAMALIVNQTTPKMLQSANLSHYQMIRQFEKSYAVRDKQDVLAMCSLQYATKLIQKNNFDDVQNQENLKKLSNINELIQEHITNFL